MPTYEYECQSCHERVEAVQKFADPSLTTCPHCGGELRKVFSAVGIVFRGSGFYKNDSRGAKSPATPTDAPSGDATTPAPSKESTSASTTTKAPAPTASTSSQSSPSPASPSSD
jgi:putative FmdB family regulatory protein